MGIMMRILFVASAVADMSKIKSPLDDLSTQHVQQAIVDTLNHMSNGDCKKLKSHLTPKLKESLKRVGKLVEDVGKVAGDANPMISPVVTMATSYITTAGKTMIDTAVNNHACDVMIHSVPEPVRQQVIPKISKLVSHLDDPAKCSELQKFIRTAGGQVKRIAGDVADYVADQLQSLEEFDKESMTPFIKMGKKWFLGLIDGKMNEMIDSHLCTLVYGLHDHDEL